MKKLFRYNFPEFQLCFLNFAAAKCRFRFELLYHLLIINDLFLYILRYPYTFILFMVVLACSRIWDFQRFIVNNQLVYWDFPAEPPPHSACGPRV